MSAQLKLPLRLPAEHYDLVSPYQQRELVAFTPQQAKNWHVLNRDVARDTLSRWVDEPDIYVTPNEFYNWRRIKNAAALNAMYVDIDAHNGQDVMKLVTAALSALDAERVPEPNCIVYTGRGAHVYWLINRTAPQALPRWQACQRRLVEICKGDRMSADATRVLRVVGTTNSKAENFKVSAEPIHPIRYDFDWLADQVMPFSRAEIRDIRAARAVRQLDTAAPATQTKTGSIYDRWYLVYRDLHTIVDHNWFGSGIESGHRDTLLFHMANALSWFTVSDSLEHEIEHLARQITPSLSAAEAKGYCSSVISRARDTHLKGDEKRYRYKRETLYNQLSPLIPADLLPRLRAIIPDELAAERKRDSNRKSKAKSRAKAGAVSRSVYVGNAQEKRQKALELRAEGLSVRAIAAQLGASTRSIFGYLKEAAQCAKSVPLV
jgi:hypothetical protein